MHGDYHMMNALTAPGPPGRVVAILDWETATIGDPLLDLVLYNFRLAVLQEGIYRRSLHDPTRPDRPASGERALAITARAVELISAGQT